MATAQVAESQNCKQQIFHFHAIVQPQRYNDVQKQISSICRTHWLDSGVISKYFSKGALGTKSESGCDLFASTPMFLKMETR